MYLRLRMRIAMVASGHRPLAHNRKAHEASFVLEKTVETGVWMNAVPCSMRGSGFISK
jgi:hypothetical protein